MAYTAKDFDENGELIRDPRYMVGENLASQNIAQPSDEEEKSTFHIQHNGKAYQVTAASQEEAVQKVLDATGGQKQAEDPAEQTQRENMLRMQEVTAAMQTVASDPVGPPVRDPRASSGPLGRVKPPAPQEQFVLERQAQARGIDVTTGASLGVRLGQGLANLKDPQLRMQMLDGHYRAQLYESGVNWPEGVPVVMLEEQTGQLAYVRAITEDDLLRGEKPENVGKTRLTLVDNSGLDLGDMAEWLPTISLAVGETGGAMIAGLLKSPQAALFASSTITAGIEALATPVKNKLLKEYYGVTDEELAKFSDPNEALNQAMLAGGLEYGMGQAMVFARWAKNLSSNRTLTEGDYKALVAELDKTRQLNAEFKAVTGETVDDPIMFVEAASKKMDTMTGQSVGVKAVNYFKRLPEKWRRVFSTANDVTRLKLARGFRYVTNNTTDVSRMGLDENGLITPRGSTTDNAEQILRTLEDAEGVTAARRTARITEDEATQTMEALHDVATSAHYRDIQEIGHNTVVMLKQNEELQWSFFKDMLEPNSTGSAYGIVLQNGRNSPVRRALGGLSREAEQNLSKSMGERTQGFVEDMAALRGDTIDIMAMHRLRSDLLRAKRKIHNNTDINGWTATELDEVIDALDRTMQTQDWVRASTGRKVPGLQRNALNQYARAREATEVMNIVSAKSSIQDMIDTVAVVDSASMRKFGERRKFTMMPAKVRDQLFEPNNASALSDVLDLSGSHPGLRAALADQLEGVYKKMALNPDGSFARGGYNRFMSEYGDHAELLFGPENAARIHNADSMARAVEQVNITAKKVEDAFRATFGDAVDPQKLGANGLVRTIMNSSNVTARQTRTLMNRLNSIDPAMAMEVRAEFAQWAHGELMKSPVVMKDGNAIRNWLGNNQSKIRAVMGNQYFNDMRTIQKFTELVDYSDAARGVSEPVQAAWLQVTRSVFGPLSKKQRFMTAANRILRGRSAKKALELMADPENLRKFVRLGKMDPSSLAFWATADQLGLRLFFEEEGLVPPKDMKTTQIREEAMRRLAQGGPL